MGEGGKDGNIQGILVTEPAPQRMAMERANEGPGLLVWVEETHLCSSG